MCPAKYYDTVKDCSSPFNTRLRMVQRSFETNICKTAKEYGTTRITVRKWKRAYEVHGTKGLISRSKAPKRIPHKTPKIIEDEILRHRDVLPSWGPIRLKEDFNIPVSTGAIYRILKQSGRIDKKRRKKHDIKKELSKIKMQLRSFQKIQIDVKDLSDIPRYYRLMRLNDLPRYQFTARDVKSGMLYIAYARRHDCINAANFLTLLAEHLKEHNIDLSKVSIQTDNGSEFIGNWRMKSRSLFVHMSEKVFGMKHYRIPPNSPTYNSDVETSHLRIEKDFYDLEDFDTIGGLSIKALTYLLQFNLLRRNRMKFNKTSFEIVKEENPDIKKTIVQFPTIVLDDIGTHYLKYVSKPNPVYDVPELAIFTLLDRFIAICSTDRSFYFIAGNQPKIFGAVFLRKSKFQRLAFYICANGRF